MKESLSGALPVVLAAIGFLLVTVSNVEAQSKVAAESFTEPVPTVGQVIPDVELKDSTGKQRSLASFRGKVVLLDFWASWCGPCRQANPALKKIYSRYQAHGFEIFAVSLDRSESSWKQAIRADDLQWIQVIDETLQAASVASRWKIDYIPTSFLLGKDGRVIKINPGPRALTTYLKKHLQ